MALLRGDLVPLEALWGRSGACLRERLLEAPTPEDALAVMEDALLQRLTSGFGSSSPGPASPGPDPAVVAAAGALSRGARVGEVSDALGLLPRTLRRQPHLADEFRELAGVTPTEYLRSRVNGPNHLLFLPAPVLSEVGCVRS